MVKRNSNVIFIHFIYEPRATCPAHRLMTNGREQQSQLWLGEACSPALAHPGRQGQGPAWMERQSGWLSHTHTHNLLLLSSNTSSMISHTQLLIVKHTLYIHTQWHAASPCRYNKSNKITPHKSSHRKEAWRHNVPKQASFPQGKVL